MSDATAPCFPGRFATSVPTPASRHWAAQAASLALHAALLSALAWLAAGPGLQRPPPDPAFQLVFIARPPPKPAPPPTPMGAAPAPPPAMPAIRRASDDAPGTCSDTARPVARRGLQGRVLLRVSVAEDGTPIAVRIAASSGSPLLDSTAAATVRDCMRFPVALQAGMPVAYSTEAGYNFRLEK